MDNLEKELDRLYALEPGAFTAERDRLARELREAGRREESDQVKRLRKPTLSAWTINRLTREERRNIDLLLDAGHRLREAQQNLLAGKDTGSLDEARQTERTALADLRKAARRILAEEGRGSDTTLNRIMATLGVAAVSNEGRELLARGRLSSDLEATGFDLIAPPPEGGSRGKRLPRKREPKQRRAASSQQREKERKRLEEARRRLRDARATAKEAAESVRAAELDAGKARRELERAEEWLRTEQAAAAQAERAVERAERQLREAGKSA